MKLNYRHALLIVALSTPLLHAQETDETVFELESYEVLGRGIDSRNIVPTRLIESPFGGFGSVVEIPRSVTLVSSEQLEAFGIRNYDELTPLSSSLFSSSLFGIAGTPDIRGAIAETYYRGMKRADNRAIFPQPIGAAEYLDIVKGPPTPLMGVGSMGGYVNFHPKSVRSRDGVYLDRVLGQVSLQYGSYDQKVIDAEVGGPLELPFLQDREVGYYIYASLEDSDSYYLGNFNRFGILQASFTVQLAPNLRLEAGGQFQSWEGTEVAGINRITQELIDDGLYQTGSAFTTNVNGEPLDINQDGRLSANEVITALSLPPVGDDPLGNPVIRWNTIDPATNQGLVKLDRSRTIIDPGDLASMDGVLAYLDLIYGDNGGWQVENKLFYDGYENFKDTSQGFNSVADTFVIEDKLIARAPLFESENLLMQNAFVASIRHQNVDRALGYEFQNFNRRDVSQGPTVADTFHRYTEDGATEFPFTEQWQTDYTGYAIGWQGNLEFQEALKLDLGVRFDSYDVDHTYSGRPLLFPGNQFFSPLLADFGPGGSLGYDPATDEVSDFITTESNSGSDDGVSYTASLSYSFLDDRLTAYATYGLQSDINRGDAGEYPYPASQSIDGNFLAESELMEFGLKGLFLENQLFLSLAWYELERASYDARSQTSNDYVTEGIEIEARWQVSSNFSLFANANFQESEYLAKINVAGVGDTDFPFFLSDPSFAGIDITSPDGLLDSSFDTGLAFFSDPYADLPVNDRLAIPDEVISVGGTYISDGGIGVAGAVTYYGETGLARPWFVTLPDYYLGVLTLFYQAETWSFSFRINNLLDEEYWQNTAPDNLGGATVIAMPPRTYEATLTYAF